MQFVWKLYCNLFHNCIAFYSIFIFRYILNVKNLSAFSIKKICFSQIFCNHKRNGLELVVKLKTHFTYVSYKANICLVTVYPLDLYTYINNSDEEDKINPNILN